LQQVTAASAGNETSRNGSSAPPARH
jgi:hypothetical protein